MFLSTVSDEVTENWSTVQTAFNDLTTAGKVATGIFAFVVFVLCIKVCKSFFKKIFHRSKSYTINKA